MLETPIVTIAIPTYNRAAFLEVALGSALDQTYENLEVIVLDNCSDDRTAHVVSSFRDERLTYCRNESNIGPHANLTACLKAGTSDFVAILQDDDVMLPTNIEKKLSTLLEHNNAVLAHSAFQFIDERGRLILPKVSWWDAPTRRETPLEFIIGTFKTGLRVDLSSPLMRRRAVSDEEFDPADGVAADYGLFLRVARKGDIVYLDDSLTASRRHAGSLSVRTDAVMDEHGFYATTFDYVAGCRSTGDRFIAEFSPEVANPRTLRRLLHRWTCNQLVSAVRVETRDDPTVRRTLSSVRRAAAIDPRVLLRKRVALILGWTLVGPRGRAMAGRL